MNRSLSAARRSLLEPAGRPSKVIRGFPPSPRGEFGFFRRVSKSVAFTIWLHSAHKDESNDNATPKMRKICQKVSNSVAISSSRCQ